MIVRGNAEQIPLSDRSVQCVVTSPPYWLLRDYGLPGQLGQEPTPAEYVDRMVGVMREVWRVLRDDGTVWLNLGDSYSGSRRYRTVAQATAKSGLEGGKTTQAQCLVQAKKSVGGLKCKQLVGIPWRVAFALQDDGWFVRSEIIWSKTNAMPSSVRDRPGCAHETIFLLSKRPKYYYDREAVMVPAKSKSIHHFVDARADKQRGHGRVHAGFNGRYAEKLMKEGGPPKTRNLRNVWSCATVGYKGAHYAVFPSALIKPCILAGCPVGGLVLDPFAGTGTTVATAIELGRRGIGVELGMGSCCQAMERLAKLAPSVEVVLEASA